MSQIKIMIVEDESITAADIRKQLEKLGYQVPGIVATGEEAITQAEKRSPDLILMDIVLKGKVDGIEAAKHINAKQHIPIIFLTAYNDAETINKAKSSLPYGYITKPYEINVLRIAVELALYKAKMESAAAFEEETKQWRLREINLLKDELLENMSKELKTPLNEIIKFSELLSTEMVGPTAAEKEYLSGILTCAKLLSELINDLLALTEIESKGVKPHWEQTDLTELVISVADYARELAENKKVSIDVDIAPELAIVALDRDYFKQVLFQYISNALKFTPEEGSIKVRVQPESKNAYRVEVQDTGIGIKKEDLKKLFVKFQKLDSEAQKNQPGVGIGLAIVKRIVESMKGTVGVQSNPGKGSTFYAVFPFAD